MKDLLKISNGNVIQAGKFPESENITPHETNWTSVDVTDAIQCELSSSAAFTFAAKPTDTGFTSSLPVVLDVAGINTLWIKGTATISVLKNQSKKFDANYFTLSGTVTNEAAEPLAAVVTISPVDFSGVDVIRTAAATGVFDFTVFQSRYNMSVLIDGYLSASAAAVDCRLADKVQNFTLTAE